MNDLFSQFSSQFFPKKILVAFSGGLDSTVLLSLFVKLKKITPHFQLRAIHIHHGISPNADSWALHCQQVCQQLGIPLIIEKIAFDRVKNIEANARTARYQAIKQHLQQDEVLTTAHHQNDVVETFFLNLKRGSGLQGLSAMQRESQLWEMSILRPLLYFSREQLEIYARSEKLAWIEDESNQQNHYDRNFLRNEILPKLQQRWAFFSENVARTSQLCFEQQALIDELLETEFNKNFEKQHCTFSLIPLLSNSKQKAYSLLRMWLKQCGQPMPSQKQLAQIMLDVVNANEDRNPQFQLDDKIIRRYQNRLYLTPIYQNISGIKLPLFMNKTLELPDNLGQIKLTEQDNYRLLGIWKNEENKIQFLLPKTTAPIFVGFSYSGKVKIDQSGYHRDIKKVWQSHQIPPWQRHRIPLIFYGEKLKSAVGVFEVLAD